MRSRLLAGAAVCAVCLVLPSVPQVEAPKGSASFDPLA
jgi:hypothetical protein